MTLGSLLFFFFLPNGTFNTSSWYVMMPCEVKLPKYFSHPFKHGFQHGFLFSTKWWTVFFGHTRLLWVSEEDCLIVEGCAGDLVLVQGLSKGTTLQQSVSFRLFHTNSSVIQIYFKTLYWANYGAHSFWFEWHEFIWGTTVCYRDC